MYPCDINSLLHPQAVDSRHSAYINRCAANLIDTRIADECPISRTSASTCTRRGSTHAPCAPAGGHRLPRTRGQAGRRPEGEQRSRLVIPSRICHIALSLTWVFEGFILKPDFPGGPPAYFENTRTPVLVAKDAVLLVQTLLGDSIYVRKLLTGSQEDLELIHDSKIWRCYMVWGRRKRIIIVPVITLILASVYTCMTEYTLAHTKDNVFDEPGRWVKGFCGFMLATIVYCNACSRSVAIIWKIWRTHGSKHTATLVVIIEAGALYTANLITFLVTYVIGSTAQYIVLDLSGPLVPIIFCLIILQIKYHRASDTSMSVMTAPNGSGIRSATFDAMEHRMSQRQKKQRGDTDIITATTLSNSDSMHQPTEIRIEMPQHVVKHHIYVGETETQCFGPEGDLQPDVSDHSGDNLRFRSGEV
ncbi:hypothetical protein EVG20_g4306 [Dentipellis fragilis]|uniref:Uncharacterized protein n=1 Tax=Dentipellis fragilis TaxID=205917 RepID=A0A4Y9YWU5_9AGAM|nr:hypothetical protein EVG20_g4306 [Dentipellis fragilis]